MSAGDYRTLGLSVPVSEVLDPRLWRERYAFGTPAGTDPRSPAAVRRSKIGGGVLERALSGTMTDAEADEVARAVAALPDRTILWHLRAAVSELELKLGLRFGVEVLKADPVDDGLVEGQHFDRRIGRFPYFLQDARQYFKIDVPGPIVSVQRVRAYYFGQKIWEFDGTTANSSVRVEWAPQGAIHLMPLSLQGLILTGNGQYGVWHTVALHRSPLPDFWAVDYTTGPVARDGSVGRIEAVLAHWCYAVAGMTLLSLSGMAQSKGLSSASVSMDGVSRSIGLQASAIYGLNSATEHVYDETTKRIDWKELRAQKRGMRILPFGS